MTLVSHDDLPDLLKSLGRNSRDGTTVVVHNVVGTDGSHIMQIIRTGTRIVYDLCEAPRVLENPKSLKYLGTPNGLLFTQDEVVDLTLYSELSESDSQP